MMTARTPAWEQLADELPQRVDEQPPMLAQTPAEALRNAGITEAIQEGTR